MKYKKDGVVYEESALREKLLDLGYNDYDFEDKVEELGYTPASETVNTIKEEVKHRGVLLENALDKMAIQSREQAAKNAKGMPSPISSLIIDSVEIPLALQSKAGLKDIPSKLPSGKYNPEFGKISDSVNKQARDTLIKKYFGPQFYSFFMKYSGEEGAKRLSKDYPGLSLMDNILPWWGTLSGISPVDNKILFAMGKGDKFLIDISNKTIHTLVTGETGRNSKAELFAKNIGEFLAKFSYKAEQAKEKNDLSKLPAYYKNKKSFFVDGLRFDSVSVKNLSASGFRSMRDEIGIPEGIEAFVVGYNEDEQTYLIVDEKGETYTEIVD